MGPWFGVSKASIRAMRCRGGSTSDTITRAPGRRRFRCEGLHVRIPWYHVAMLEHIAEREHATVSSVLARELDGVASANAEDLSWSIAGFDAAIQWPDGDGAELLC